MSGPRRLRLVALFLLCSVLPSVAAVAADRLRFWNTSSVTITTLYLAPAGTSNWGAEQCRNDPDKSVSADERLTLTPIDPGRYDVKLTDATGRSCIVRNVEVKSGGPYAFSIDDSDLAGCK